MHLNKSNRIWLKCWYPNISKIKMFEMRPLNTSKRALMVSGIGTSGPVDWAGRFSKLCAVIFRTYLWEFTLQQTNVRCYSLFLVSSKSCMWRMREGLRDLPTLIKTECTEDYWPSSVANTICYIKWWRNAWSYEPTESYILWTKRLKRSITEKKPRKLKGK